MHVREALSALLICAALTACARGGDEPRPTTTLEPSIVESSTLPTNAPDNKACKLLSAEERAALPGLSMNQRVPVQPAAGTEECVWVHSRRQRAGAAIRLVAFNARLWAPQAASQVNRAMHDPSVSPALAKKLEEALKELTTEGRALAPERICEIYLLAQEARGLRRTSDLVYFAHIGSMPAAYGISCENGVLIMAGYGEYGVQSSIALNHGVVRLAEAANERAPAVFGTDEEATANDGPATNDEEPTEPSPEPAGVEEDTDSD